MAKKADTTKVESLKRKRRELEANGVKTRNKTTSPTPRADTPKTKWDPVTKKRVREVIEEEDRKKPKVLTAKTPDTGGASSVVGVDMYTTSLPTGMSAQSFSRSAAPKPFDVQFRPDGKLYVYGPIWNTYAVKLSKDGAPAVEGKWNSVGAPTCSTLYAVQEDTLGDACEVKSSKHYLAFSVGKDSDDVKYTATKVAKKFDGLGWRSLASGALITVGGASEAGVAVEDTPLAWTVQKRKSSSTDASAEDTWQIFSPVWVAGGEMKSIHGAELGKWSALPGENNSGMLYAVYKEESPALGEGESEEDVTWTFTSLTLSDTPGENQAPTYGTGDAKTGIRFINVPIGKFVGEDFTQYHEGVIVTGYSGGSGGGSSWGYGPVEWDQECSAYVQYRGTFDGNGAFTKCTTKGKTAVINVVTHACDHTAELI